MNENSLRMSEGRVVSIRFLLHLHLDQGSPQAIAVPNRGESARAATTGRRAKPFLTRNAATRYRARGWTLRSLTTLREASDATGARHGWMRLHRQQLRPSSP